MKPWAAVPAAKSALVGGAVGREDPCVARQAEGIERFERVHRGGPARLRAYDHTDQRGRQREAALGAGARIQATDVAELVPLDPGYMRATGQ